MAIKWNSQQKKAIDLTDKNIIVSASAGAGKTTVLIARLMKRIIEDQVSIDQIIAMTFTDAAAAEMKKRLSISLSEAYQKNPSEYLKKQMALLPSASISTIHSFCLNIIKNYYFAIQLEPTRISNILDDATLALLKKEALEDTFNDAFKHKDEAFVQLLDTFSASAIDQEDLEKAILQLAKTAKRHLNYETYLNQISNNYQKYSRIDLLPNDLKTLFFESYRVQCDVLISHIQDLSAYVLQTHPTEAAYILANQAKLDKAYYMLAQIRDENYDRFVSATISCMGVDLKSSLDKDPIYKEFRDNVIGCLKSILEGLYDSKEYLLSIEYQKPLIEKLAHMTQQYLEKYEQLKIKHNGIDFDDMEQFAYAILTANNNEVAHIYQNQYIDIMVDEFQDTNIIQNEMVELISRKNNVFRVGDIKQSIYRFRGAKPNIMQELMQEDPSIMEVIYLNNNYRSKQDIVDFNNDMFDQMMNIDGLKSSYNEFDYVQTGIDSQKEGCFPVEFHLIQKKDMTQFPDDGFLDATQYNDHELKAHYIASKIVTLVKEEQRKFKDIAILIRNHNMKLHLMNAFEQLNVPYSFSLVSGFYQSSSVSSVMAYLHILNNPTDKINLIAVLKNIYHIDNDTLAKHQLNDTNLLDLIKDDYYALKNPTMSICDVLTYIFKIQNFYDLHCTKKERNNLDLLFEKAAQYQKTQPNLYTYVSFILAIEDEKTSEAMSKQSDEDVVTVMTIHQSKGLQFPVVFFCSSFTQHDLESKNKLACDEYLGVALNNVEFPYRFSNLSLYRKALDFNNTKEDFEEQMRLLYVGLTRAQQQMFIIDVFSKNISKRPLNLAGIFSRIGFSGWLLKCMLQEKPYFKTVIIDKAWELISHTAPVQTKHIHTLWTKTVKQTKMVSPSETEKHEILPFVHTEKTGSAVGTSIHHAIQNLPNTVWTLEMLEPFHLSTYYLNALLQFSSSAFYKQLLTMPVYKELPFVTQIEHSIVQGIMDFVAMDEKEAIIVDFKTDSILDAEVLKEKYMSQLTLYQKAIETIYPNLAVSCYLYSFSMHQFIQIK